MAYENYAGGILVICIEILNDCFILYQLATMSPLG